jgi:hypothetical protein
MGDLLSYLEAKETKEEALKRLSKYATDLLQAHEKIIAGDQMTTVPFERHTFK